jgi:protein-disulfide isomerase
MSKRSKKSPEGSVTTPEATRGADGPTPESWAGLAALGAVAALWALFLWGELVVARTGGTPFCALGGAADCARVWDSSFATAVHGLTGLPIAAWGVAWGLVAFALPLLGLLRAAQGRPLPALVSATRLTAAAGVLTVLVMIAVSASERAFCLGCFGTYVIVAGYAGVGLFGWQHLGMPDLSRGATLAAGALIAAAALLLYPGLRTPRSAEEAGRAAIPPPAASPGEEPDAAPRHAGLQELVASLDPRLKQGLADALDAYRHAPSKPVRTPRVLQGPAEAPVRITEFTDVLCSHCAELHKTLAALTTSLPPGSFAVEARQFPLDAECNPLVSRSGEPVRCLAAKVKICMEGREGESALATALFENQKGLTPEGAFSLAAPYRKRSDLEACVASPETAAKLADDVRYAQEYSPDGTPIVLINGRLGSAFGAFLYAMVLTRGGADDPAFASLPPPTPHTAAP